MVHFAKAYVESESPVGRIARIEPLTPSDVAALGEPHCPAYAQRVVHRDAKADNVLVDNQHGFAVVTAFGIARVVDSHSPRPTHRSNLNAQFGTGRRPFGPSK